MPEDLDALLSRLDAEAAPPWSEFGVVEAASWAEAEARIRAWRFT